MPVAPIIAGVALATAAVGTVATISSQNKMAKAQKKQYAFERQMQQNRSVRERRDAIRAQRIAGGTLVQNSVNSGGSSTSAALGGMGSIVSQLNGNLSFLDTQSSLADKAGAQSQVAASARANGAKWGAITDLGMSVFNVADSRGKK